MSNRCWLFSCNLCCSNPRTLDLFLSAPLITQKSGQHFEITALRTQLNVQPPPIFFLFLLGLLNKQCSSTSSMPGLGGGLEGKSALAAPAARGKNAVSWLSRSLHWEESKIIIHDTEDKARQEASESVYRGLGRQESLWPVVWGPATFPWPCHSATQARKWGHHSW